MMIASEHQEQVAFIEWFHLKYKSLVIFAVPNGGNRNIVTALKLKKEGVLKGVPDLVVLMPKSKIVFIEMKRVKNSRLSQSQLDFINTTKVLGHDVIVGYGASDASIKFMEYIELSVD